MKSINRTSCINIAAVFVIGLLVVNATAQGEEWRITSSIRDASGMLTIISEAGDLKKTTTETYLPNDPGSPKYRNEVTTDASGKQIHRYYRIWVDRDTQVSEGVEEYDDAKKIKSGTRWTLTQVAPGIFVGPKIFEKFVPGTGKWVTVTAPAKPAATPAPKPSPAASPAPAAVPPINNPPASNGNAPSTTPTNPGKPAVTGRDQIIAAMERSLTTLKRRAAEATADPRKRPLVENDIRLFLQYVDVEMGKDNSPEHSAKLADLYNATDELQRSFKETPAKASTPSGPVQELGEINWGDTPDGLDLSDKVGKRFAVKCPPTSGTTGTRIIFGNGPFAGTSTICNSALYSGHIGLAGGKVTFEIASASSTYQGTTNWEDAPNYSKNGVQAYSYPSPVAQGAPPRSSFTFVK